MRTIEEAAFDCAMDNTYERDMYVFKQGVEFAQRWISVEEELPEDGTPVLMKTNYGLYGIGEIKRRNWRFYSVESYAEMLSLKEHSLGEISKVTHWRSIELK